LGWRLRIRRDVGGEIPGQFLDGVRQYREDATVVDAELRVLIVTERGDDLGDY
jgi:hypothetical protein